MSRTPSSRSSSRSGRARWSCSRTRRSSTGCSRRRRTGPRSSRTPPSPPCTTASGCCPAAADVTLRAVLFDLDDTLFDHRAAVDTAILAHLGATGVPVPDADAALVRWRDLEEHHYHRYLAGELDYLQQRRERAGGLMAAYGAAALADDEADAWWADYLREYRGAWRLHDDALPCLDALIDRFSGVRLGIITNGELDFQMTKLEATQLAARMDSVIASGEVGVTKPDARIFELACDRLGVEPAEAAYVGDRLRTDAMGAAAAGLTGVWLDRRSEVVDPERWAEAERLGVVRVTGLDEVPAVLARV